MIIAVETDMPVTTPVPDPTVATAVLPLVHVPPPDASLKAIVDPTQTDGEPVMANGKGFTVTTTEAEQPVLRV